MKNFNLFILSSIFLILFSLNFYVFEESNSSALKHINHSILNDAEFLITPSIKIQNNQNMTAQEFINSINQFNNCPGIIE